MCGRGSRPSAIGSVPTVRKKRLSRVFFVHRYAIVVAVFVASAASAVSVPTAKSSVKQTPVAAPSEGIAYTEFAPEQRVFAADVEDAYDTVGSLESGKIKAENAVDFLKKLSKALVGYASNYLQNLDYNGIFKGVLLEAFIRITVAVVGAAVAFVVPAGSVKSLLETLPSYSKLLIGGKGDSSAYQWQLEQLADFALDAFNKYEKHNQA